MKPSITSYIARKMWQEANHPEWTPDVGDLVYVCHGTGSDRDRVFTLAELFSSNKEIQLLTDNVTGDTHSLTSADIVAAFKAGRIPVVVGGGGASGVLTRLYYLPKKIYYNDNSTSDIDRDCEFYCFGDDGNGHKVLTWRRYYNIPVQGQGEKYSETVVDLTYPASMHSDELLLGSKWKIEKYVNGGAEALVVQRLNGSTWEDVAVFRADGTRLTLTNGRLDLDNWKIQNVDETLEISSTDASPVVAMSVNKSTGGITVHHDLKVNGVFTQDDNVIESTNSVSLIGETINNLPNKTIVTVCNTNTSSSINVTYATNKTENLASMTARQYVKTSGGWCILNAYDPTATH